ncbi:hypothetical protein [Pseudocolwellia agarivorans]|uniref:hypothetical protein n=1 Tax=Pseudocolwellia agarivorans TaxID=1911682 RepID=UPI003F883852
MPPKPKITEDIQFKIECMIRLWDGKLTWNLLTQKIHLELGLKVSRQTLEDYKGIYVTYKHQKQILRGVTPKLEKSITKSDVNLIKRIEKLEVEIEIKDKTINEQKRFLQRILQNATEIPALRGNLEVLIAERPEDKL